MDFKERLLKAKKFGDIFDIVQDIVHDFLGLDQAGLVIGVTDLGIYENGFIGAFYSPDANMIIINKKPLQRILQKSPLLYNNYIFHVMLHEYIHSVGSLDEAETRSIVFKISDNYFGDSHTVTKLAGDIKKFLPDLTYVDKEFALPKDINIEFVSGIDRRNANYIN